MKPSTILFVAVNFLGLASAAAIADPEPYALAEPDVEALDPLVSGLEKRKCFESGAKWSSVRKNAIAEAEKHCKGKLKGKYKKRETRVVCQNLPGAKHVVFTIGLTGANAPTSRTLGTAECVDGLTSEIQQCARGGDTTYGRWRYR